MATTPTTHQDDFERLPAFQLGRFKKTLHADFNEEFAADLLGLMNQATVLPKHLYAFRQKLDQKLNDSYVPGQPFVDHRRAV